MSPETASFQTTEMTLKIPLTPEGLSESLSAETPKTRRRKRSMSRRYQAGSVIKYGNWWIVRFRVDVPNQLDRALRYERICPIDGPGRLPVGEIRRRAASILDEKGINAPEQFAQMNNGTTFKQQSDWFMTWVVTRKRKPIKTATANTWRMCLDKWLNPAVGDLPLAAINNSTLKELVTKLSAAKLSPKTIVNYTQLMKMVVASAVDEQTGDQLFPIKWNHDFADMPVVGKQHQPSLTEDEMTKIAAEASGREQMLYVLIAATGLRIGEALGLEVKHLSDDCTLLSVEQSLFAGKVQDPKTPAAVRVVDVPGAVASLLKAYIADRKDGFVFATRNGHAILQSNLLRRKLHPLLRELKIKRVGFHSFRRFRATWLDMSGAPESFIKHALGHANKTVTDKYKKSYSNPVWRKEIVEKVGTGFEIPTVVRTVRKSEEK
jgi:integrase